MDLLERTTRKLKEITENLIRTTKRIRFESKEKNTKFIIKNNMERRTQR